jgi:hypothetical protein
VIKVTRVSSTAVGWRGELPEATFLSVLVLLAVANKFSTVEQLLVTCEGFNEKQRILTK